MKRRLKRENLLIRENGIQIFADLFIFLGSKRSKAIGIEKERQVILIFFEIATIFSNEHAHEQFKYFFSAPISRSHLFPRA